MKRFVITTIRSLGEAVREFTLTFLSYTRRLTGGLLRSAGKPDAKKFCLRTTEEPHITNEAWLGELQRDDRIHIYETARLLSAVLDYCHADAFPRSHLTLACLFPVRPTSTPVDSRR